MGGGPPVGACSPHGQAPRVDLALTKLMQGTKVGGHLTQLDGCFFASVTGGDRPSGPESICTHVLGTVLLGAGSCPRVGGWAGREKDQAPEEVTPRALWLAGRATFVPL